MKTIQELILSKVYRIIVIAFIACGFIFLSSFIYSYHKNNTVNEKYIVQVLINKVTTLIQNHSHIIKKLEKEHQISDIHFILADTINNNDVITEVEYIKSTNNIDSNIIDGVDYDRVFKAEPGSFIDIYSKYKDKKNNELEYRFTHKNQIPVIEFLLPIYSDNNIFIGLLKYTASMLETENKMAEERRNYYSFIFVFLSVFTLVIIITLFILHKIIKDISIDITNPIQDLIIESNKISSGEYNSSITIKHNSDEVSKLSASLETMRQQIKNVLLEMNNMNANLEEEVRKRTVEIEELKKEETQKAHAAGASSVIESVLHNIGNVLNTMNVSNYNTMSVINDSKFSVVSKLTNKLSEALETDNIDIENLLLLEKAFLQCQSIWEHEISSIHSNQVRMDESIQIINDIISHHRSTIKLSTFKEEFYIRELINSIADNYQSPETIISIKDNDKDVLIYNEKNKLHQVITNIVVNAIEAKAEERIPIIDIDIEEKDDFCVINFTDNGIGIESDLMSKIFQPRVTTKNRGSGFGLNSCMNIMTDIGGKLLVHSEGRGQGSTFTLHIPLKNSKEPELATV